MDEIFRVFICSRFQKSSRGKAIALLGIDCSRKNSKQKRFCHSRKNTEQEASSQKNTEHEALAHTKTPRFKKVLCSV